MKKETAEKIIGLVLDKLLIANICQECESNAFPTFDPKNEKLLIDEIKECD